MISEKADTPSAVRPVGFWSLFCFMERNALCGQTTGPLALGGNRNCCFGREHEPVHFWCPFPSSLPHIHSCREYICGLCLRICLILFWTCWYCLPCSLQLLESYCPLHKVHTCPRLIYLCNTPRKKNIVILLLQKGKVWGLFPEVPVNRCLTHEFA